MLTFSVCFFIDTWSYNLIFYPASEHLHLCVYFSYFYLRLEIETLY